MERIAINILKTVGYLGLAMSHQITKSTSLPSALLPLPPANTWNRLKGLLLDLQNPASLHHSGHMEPKWVNSIGA